MPLPGAAGPAGQGGLGAPLDGPGGFNPQQWPSANPFGQQPFGGGFGEPLGQQPFGQQPGQLNFGQRLGLLFGQQPIEQHRGNSPNFIQDWIHGVFGQQNPGNPFPPPFGQHQGQFIPFIHQVPKEAIDKAHIPENLSKKD